MADNDNIGTLVIDDPLGPNTGEFGNNFNGVSDADGEITATFTGGTTDLVLNFDGFDIDTGAEVEVFLNNGTTDVSLGVLAAGVNDGLSSYSMTITGAQQGDGVENTITFKQIDNITYKWGVTNVELVNPPTDPDIGALVVDDPLGPNTGEFGNNFNGATDADGEITATFTGGTTDLVLNFDGFDIDTGAEVEVFLNNGTTDVSLGVLAAGVNDGLSSYSMTITGAQQGDGVENTITFKQIDNITYKWGVTNVELVNPPTDQDIGALVIDDPLGPNTGEFGNNFNGVSDADGEITATFTGGTTDLVLNFDGFDIDSGAEVEVFLNNGTTDVSLGVLAAGVNDGLSSYSMTITGAQQGDGVENTITFKQIDNITFKWGVTNVELVNPPSADMALVVDDPLGPNTGEFGNNFNGATDADGEITATFTGGTTDLVLNFDGFDIDSGAEVEVFLNNGTTDVSLGVLAAGVNDGLSSYSITITGAQQGDLVENTITFKQIDNITYKWGVTNVELVNPPTADMALVVDDPLGPNTGEFGNNFNGATDADGEITATFTGGTTDLVLNFDGFDIDSGAEVEVFLNNGTTDVSLGVLAAGVNDGLSSYSITITGAQQGDLVENTITFKQIDNITYKWGVTNVELVNPPTDQDIGALVIDDPLGPNTGEFGNNFNGATDADGEITATFTGGTTDLVLNFDGFDIDSGAEVEVFLNNGATDVSLGVLAAGVNDGLSSYSITITGAQQGDLVENTITFKQIDNITYKWGVTNVELVTPTPPSADMALVIDDPLGPNTGEFGNNFNGATDADGEITATFTGGTTDLVLNFDGFDIDSGAEVEVFLNNGTTDVSLGVLAAGVNDGLSSYSMTITGAQQGDGVENTITFKQIDNITYKWGVTNVELVNPPTDPDIGALVVDDPLGPNTGEFGNNFNGATDADGEITATFTGGTTDLVLNFDGFDIDTGAEVEVFLNNGTTDVSLGVLAAGVNDGLSSYSMTITGAQQGDGVENTITFKQIDNITYKWGVTNVELVNPPTDQDIGALVVDDPLGPNTGEFGNNFNGATDADGEITATFTGGTTDLVLNFDGFDIDTGAEVEVFLNNGTTDVSLGVLIAGVNDGLSSYSMTITGAQQGDGVENTITFKQIDNITYKWGVTNVELVTAPAFFSPSDPLYAQQWHLGEIGSLEQIWAEYTGTGVSVAVYDDGLQATHHDLNDNYLGDHVVVAGAVLGPVDGQHGTSVAGVIAAEADGIGAVGVAFDASLTGVNIINGPAGSNEADLTNFAEAMMQMSNFDVVNHSWGWDPPFTPDDPPPSDFYAKTLPTLENAATFGRGGLGTNIVKSAGNSSASAQGDLLSGSRYTISVGATTDKGVIASYSNHGANLLVTAPSSGEFLLDLSILTTDLLGAAGLSSGDYTGTDFLTGFGGTSSAAPVVSGVVALMLEAGPGLGWRDVQSILAYSATHAGSDIGGASPAFFEDFSWRYNGAENWNGGGLHISEDYGFGGVDAYNAVRMAEIWYLFGAPQTSANEVNFSATGTPNLAIGAGTVINLDMTGVSLEIDHVEVSVTLSDSSVDIFLISPDGTRVELYRASDAVATTVEPFDWTFGAQIFRGAQIDGLWQLDIVNSDLDAAVIVDYTIDWWGSSDGLNGYVSADDVYHYTAEMLSLDLDIDPLRVSLDDTGGVDWFDFAASAGDIVSNMSAGGATTLDGVIIVQTTAGTVIENAVAGDGDDTLLGNGFANELYGMRGNDTLDGGLGNDTLNGGSGNDIVWGDAGDDLFMFYVGDGADWVGDFNAGAATDDVIALYGFGPLDFGSLSLIDLGDDLRIDLDNGDEIVLAGVSSTALLHEDDIVFFA